MHANRILSVLSVTSVVFGALAVAWADEPAENDTEQLLIQAQKICPVMGTKLGEHGPPVRAKSGDRTVYLCCKGCFGRDIDPQHWQTVNANLAAAQGICPVMDKPLPKDPKSTVVKGRVVFLCCPPCGKKVTADPEKYLKIVDEQYRKNLGRK